MRANDENARSVEAFHGQVARATTILISGLLLGTQIDYSFFVKKKQIPVNPCFNHNELSTKRSESCTLETST
jgi:hypothetical protein